MTDIQIRSDNVDVEGIMRQIRARIREKRGVDYTEDEIKELARVKLEKFLDPTGVRSDLLQQFRRARAQQTPPPNFAFEDSTIFDTHRSIVRWIRKLLKPILKLFFNPGPISEALHIQAEVNKHHAKREELDALHYELIHNLVLETTRLGIEVKNLKMRVESMSSRLDFDERRARALEGVVQYRPGAVPPLQPPVGASPVGGDAAAQERRTRRRRRRGRKPGGARENDNRNDSDQDQEPEAPIVQASGNGNPAPQRQPREGRNGDRERRPRNEGNGERDGAKGRQRHDERRQADRNPPPAAPMDSSGEQGAAPQPAPQDIGDSERPREAAQNEPVTDNSRERLAPPRESGFDEGQRPARAESGGGAGEAAASPRDMAREVADHSEGRPPRHESGSGDAEPAVPPLDGARGGPERVEGPKARPTSPGAEGEPVTPPLDGARGGPERVEGPKARPTSPGAEGE